MDASPHPVVEPVSTTPFRLFVLGDLVRDGEDIELVSLSEYRQARALARTTLRAAELESIRKAILDLRGFIEAGSPVLERRFLEDLGGRLFDLVIRSQVRDLFITATAQRRDFVPFELFVESSALASWPWEYLFDPGAKMFVCREFHPVSRSLFGQTFSLALDQVRARPRLLVAIGSSADDDEIDVDEEVALLRTVFDRLLKQDRFDIVAEPMSARELTTRLQKSRGEFDIVHFVGHSGFDLARGEGYLRLKKAKARETTRLYANDFAQAVADSRIRLAFLNACETGRAAAAEDPARSSMAAALLQRGVPAVVAHQFSVPDNGAHFFAGVFYDMLSDGLPLIDAVRAGRAAMGYAEDGRFFDWGIPVLYTRDPQAVVFPAAPRAQVGIVATNRAGADVPSTTFGSIPGSTISIGQPIQRAAAASSKSVDHEAAAPGQTAGGEGHLEAGTRFEGEGTTHDDGFGAGSNENALRAAHELADRTLRDMSGANDAAGHDMDAIRTAADRLGKGTRPPRQPHSAVAELTVALVDIDARAGFLAATLEAANRAQRYYEFRLDYLPVPSGAVRRDITISPSPQLFISALAGFAADTPRQLGADRVCFLTRNLVAGHGSDLFAAALDVRSEVFFVSTADLREFAREAGRTFAQAVLRVCLSMLVGTDKRWRLGFHRETEGCLLDYCDDRHDIVVGLRRTTFDHVACRSKIDDRRVLEAIDAILALDA